MLQRVGKPGGTVKKGEFKDEKYSGEFVATRNPLAMITAFRGDKVNVIDFGKRTLSGAYLWKPKSGNKLEKLADNYE
jgi:hypothetical protein